MPRFVRHSGVRSRDLRDPGAPRRRGQALVEFALVLPIFLFIIAALADFGFLLFDRMTTINAAREGARAAVLRDDGAAITTESLARVNAVVAASRPDMTGVTVSTTCSRDTNGDRVPDSAFTSGNCANGVTAAGDFVRVDVSYDHQVLIPLLHPMFGNSIRVTSSSQMVLQ